MKKSKIMTVGHITRAIQRAFTLWDKADRLSPKPNWFQITKRYFERYAQDQGKHFKMAGPFGICSSFIVTIGRKYRVFEISNYRSWEIGRRLPKKIKDPYSPGSIGELNGMNFEYQAIANSTPLADLF